MLTPKIKHIAFGLLGAFLAHSAAMAAEVTYSVRMDNVYVGRVIFDHEIEEGQYVTSLEAETIGFAKAIILASFEGEATGKGEDNRQYFPDWAQIDIRTPSYQDELSYTFKDSLLQKYTRTHTSEIKINYEDYSEAVDPITAFAYLARPTLPDRICEKRFNVIDGEHILRVALLEPENRQDGRISCDGAVERVEGYDETELAELTIYKIVAVYAQNDADYYRLDWLVAETPYGTTEMAYQY